MAQLTKGMYGEEFGAIGLFGLQCGQMRRSKTKITHNSGWYNKNGEKLGFGDLSTEDFQKISAGLEDGEIFITLSEDDSFWKFVTQQGHGLILGRAKTEPAEKAPGIDYVAKRAKYIIAKGQMYYVNHCGGKKKKLL